MEKRWSGLDNLKALVIFLVVFMHSNVTYSGIGSWYYVEGNEAALDVGSKVFFGLYGAFVQSWFMGLMFLLSGFFALGSLEKRSSAAFLKDKLLRLGVPLVFYVLVMTPFILVVLLRKPFTWISFISSGAFLGATGPLWFVEVLLLLFCVLAAFRKPLVKWTTASARGLIRLRVLVPAAVLTAGVTFVIRLWWPVGAAWMNLQFGFFPAYLMLFGAGLALRRSGVLENLSPKAGRGWLAAGMLTGLPGLGILLITGGALQDASPFMGGVGWQSLAYSIWELTTAALMSAGLVLTFARHNRDSGPGTRILTRTSFGVFVFHAPVLIFLSLALAGLMLPPLVKHFLVAPTAFLLTIGLVLFLRKVPGLRFWL